MIEVGEYVRTKSGEIGIFKKYAEEGVQQWFTMLQNGTLYTTATRAIVNHSKNIIDLIEVGDIVNGILVTGKEGTLLYTEIKGIDRSGYHIPISQYGKDIKTILTKELYQANCYTVERKE